MALLDDGRTGVWNRIRKRILKRDHHTCVVCSAKATDVDHILPRVLGGGDSWGNLQSLCKRCHKRKSAADHQRIRALAMQAMAGGGGGGVDTQEPVVTGGVVVAQQSAVLKRGSKRGGPFPPSLSLRSNHEGSAAPSSNSQPSEVDRSPFSQDTADA